MDDGKPITRPKTTLHHSKTEFDGWQSITIALYMALLGYAVVVGIPVISSAWVNLLGFTEEQVGRVAGADLGGMSIGSLLASLLLNRINRRIVVFAGIVMAVVANGLCMVFLEYEYTLWLRGLAGIGSGVYTSVAIATLGGTAKPARAFNMMLFAFAFTQAAEMQILPQMSMNGIYTLFISLYLVSVPFLGWVPAKAAHREDEIELDIEEAENKHRFEQKYMPHYVPWVCLTAIFFTYINIGTYWTYIELATVRAGVDAEFIGDMLVLASFMSLCGCLVATLISDRMGLVRPLLVTLSCVALSAGIMIGNPDQTSFVTSVFAFNFLWIFVDVYQMGTMSNYDPSGKYVSLIPGAQGVGQIIGPNIAASLLGYNMGYDAVFMMCACAALMGMLIYGWIYVKLRRSLPALADAS
ncbi:MFS transporter [Pseudemcibacter aquimaris]|uniref:MFS transporter n=1 Tax=Pseudemcibacter aquimaris TaxID=2857064 RepID=UPI002012E3E8|nr:MFS transporter [Pseudemcibacter aquimaris]MCC3862092.1 MFS transporter [Pseudemcibacter aquimaris]WDU58845.1 MFS transporter [Pseudemcibacter aquimaris]